MREAVGEMGDDLEQVEARIVEIRAELESLKFDADGMDDERVALESQARCMLALEQSFKAAEAARLEGGAPMGRRER